MSDVPEYADWGVYLSLLLVFIIPSNLGYYYTGASFESVVVGLLTAIAFASSWLVIRP